MTPHDPKKLERFIHETLRALPERRAPHALERRVMAALAARAALPWWKQSFLQWPLAAKIAFVVLATTVVRSVTFAIALVTSGQEANQFTHAVTEQFGWVAQLWSFATGVGDFVSLVFSAIPPLWLYGGLAALCAGYATLFSLGAAAYRALYAQR